MGETDNNAVIVKRQNFDQAMSSIKEFEEQAQKDVSLNRVSHSGGFFGLGDHKVTGTELNTLVSQIEDQLICQNNWDIDFIKQISNIYKALDALDKEHIAGILTAANAAKVASDKATKNVQSIQKIIEVLQKFREKLNTLEHLMDVDTAWELLNEQKQEINLLCAYREELFQIAHLKDVDELWDSYLQQESELSTLKQELGKVNDSLDCQAQAISKIRDLLREVEAHQRAYEDSFNRQLAEQRDVINHQETSLSSAFNAFREEFNKEINLLDAKANEAARVQAHKLATMETAQTKSLEELSARQDETHRKLMEAQAEQFEMIRNSLEEKNAALNEQVSILKQSIKNFYIFTGGMAAVSIIHLLLNIMGVL